MQDFHPQYLPIENIQPWPNLLDKCCSRAPARGPNLTFPQNATKPIPSMGHGTGMLAYICQINEMIPNVGKYTSPMDGMGKKIHSSFCCCCLIFQTKTSQISYTSRSICRIEGRNIKSEKKLGMGGGCNPEILRHTWMFREIRLMEEILHQLVW